MFLAFQDEVFFWTDGSDVGFTALNTNTTVGNCVEIQNDGELPIIYHLSIVATFALKVIVLV